MKKFIITAAAILLLFCGCGKNDVPRIEEYTWEMTSVQSAAENGGSIAYGERGHGTVDGAVLLDMECTAENGVLTITDNTNQVTYSGTYTLRQHDPQSETYDIMLDGHDGIAVTAMTTYHDGSAEPTLIINLVEYAINFFASTEN